MKQTSKHKKQRNERDKRDERSEGKKIVRHEELKRDLTYAKSEIGTLAAKFLKNTPLLWRVAGIVIVSVLAIGTGVGVGIHQNSTPTTSGSQMIEVETHESARPEEETQGEGGSTQSTTEDYLSGMTPASFTKGADGIYRAHIDAQKLGYQKTFADEYLFDIPAELHKPSEPYVARIHIQRRADVCNSYAGWVSFYYSQGGERYGNSRDIDLSFLRGNEGEKDMTSNDFVIPLFPTNPYFDEEIVNLLLESRGVDVDIELLPAAKVQLRTWDGHSKLEQRESELFRVTGPITATTFRGCGNDTTSANCNSYISLGMAVFGYRQGDATFTPLAKLGWDGDVPQLSGSEFISGSQTLEGVELLWVSNGSEFTDTWIIE